MPRKLKVYQTAIGFFDLVIAAPSMKAALEAWGAASNLFHQGFAKEVADKATIDAALDKPGIVLRRPVGSDNPFSESVELPDDLAPEERSTRNKVQRALKPKAGNDDAAARRAAAAYEKQRQKEDTKRKRSEEAEAKARERREAAIASFQSKLDNAEREHDVAMADLETERSEIEKRIEAEENRWSEQREKLEAALQKAKTLVVK
ncbi:cell envelope biogenesis protein TolA [bacterium]|nr:MAG: cell envelope biogenesis protein TolA [bacterium]